jgi:HK97 family phage portal protein
MRIFGLEITRAKSPAGLPPPAGSLGNGWFPVIRESYTGAWQENAPPLTAASALAYFAVYGCVTLIATDIGKLALRLVQVDEDGIWTETTNPAYSPVLRKPNRYQTIIKFIEQWITSKLTAGNAYALKQRDDRGVVSALYVLDPSRVHPLIAPDGAVYYGLDHDDLTGVGGPNPGDGLVVPAREIIHDPMVTLFHPLVGVTPLYACGQAAQQGLTIQSKSEQFFRGGSHPGGVLTAPGEIGEEQAARIKKYWEENFSGANIGRVAVVGKGLTYEAMTVSAADAQLIEQLNWTAKQVCTCYHVPPALLDLDDTPTADMEALWLKYHSQCLQSLLTSFEKSLDEGLELHSPYGTEFDIDDLIWMVTATKTKAAAEAIGAGALSPDEARKKWFGLGKVTGGGTPYMQQQNYSLAALAERDADQPFSKAAPATPGPTAIALPPVDDAADEKAFGFCFAARVDTLRKSHEGLFHAA